MYVAAGSMQPDDAADATAYATLTSAKEFAERLDPVAAQRYADYLDLVIEQTSTLTTTYVRLRANLESWRSESGDRAAEALTMLAAHADRACEIATKIKGAVLDAAGAAQQTKYRTADLDDWRYPYSPADDQLNEQSRSAAEAYRDELEGSLARATAVVGGAIALAGVVIGNSAARGELLQDPYGRHGADTRGMVRDGSVAFSSKAAGAAVDPLAETMQISQTRTRPRAVVRPRALSPARFRPAHQAGVFDEFGFASDAAPAMTTQQPATEWLAEGAAAIEKPWRAPVIGDETNDAAQAPAHSPIVSVFDYEPPGHRGPR